MTMPRRAAAARAIDACMAGRAAVRAAAHAGSAAAAAACMAPARWLRVPQRRLLQPSGALHPGSEEVGVALESFLECFVWRCPYMERAQGTLWDPPNPVS